MENFDKTDVIAVRLVVSTLLDYLEVEHPGIRSVIATALKTMEKSDSAAGDEPEKKIIREALTKAADIALLPEQRAGSRGSYPTQPG